MNVYVRRLKYTIMDYTNLMVSARQSQRSFNRQ